MYGFINLIRTDCAFEDNFHSEQFLNRKFSIRPTLNDEVKVSVASTHEAFKSLVCPVMQCVIN